MAKFEREAYFPLDMIQHFIRQDRASRSRRGASRAPLFMALGLGGFVVATLLALFGGW